MHGRAGHFTMFIEGGIFGVRTPVVSSNLIPSSYGLKCSSCTSLFVIIFVQCITLLCTGEKSFNQRNLMVKLLVFPITNLNHLFCHAVAN